MSQTTTKKPHSLLEQSITFRPLYHEWALDYFTQQNRKHWTHDKVDMVDDCKQFNTLEPHEQEILRNALLMFTQMDTEVSGIYKNYFIPTFKSHAVSMMLMSFANMEAIHVAAYDRLNTSLNLPDSFYGEFLNIASMYNKYEYMQEFDVSSPQKIALTLAIVSGFIEGVVLFASFAIIVSFSSVRNSNTKKNIMFGTGQIIAMSMADESLHALGVLRLFHEYIKEASEDIDINLLYSEIEKHAHIVINNEMAFIDTIYKQHELEYLPKKSLKTFILYMINLRLHSLKMPKPQINTIIETLKSQHDIQSDININPLIWMEDRYNFGEIVNFFEVTATAYHKGLTAEAWNI